MSLAAISGHSRKHWIARLWVQKTKRNALKLNEFWRFLYFLLEHYWNIFSMFLSVFALILNVNALIVLRYHPKEDQVLLNLGQAHR